MEFIKERKVIIVLILIIAIFIIYKMCNKTEKYDYNIIESEVIANDVEKEEVVEEIILHISGAVANEGIIKLTKEARISDAIEKAGGATEKADLSKINLAYRVKDGQKIYIPTIEDKDDIQYVTENAGENVMENKEQSGKININTATQTELETLSGIGASTALKIIKHREENGNFHKIEDIMNVNGIGEAKFENIKENIEI